LNPKTRKNISTLAIWVLMGALILYMISGGFSAKAPDEITLQKFVQLVEEKKVSALHETLGSGLYSGLYADSNYAVKDLPNRADFTFSASEEEFSRSMSLLVARLEGKDAEQVSSVDYPFTFTVSQPKGESWLMVILPYLLLFGMMALFMWFLYRQQGGGKQMSNFGRSHAREYAPGQNPITFNDVAGAEEEKLELQEIVDFLKEPRRFSEVGARIPKGVLLVGPPGTGKTLMAKAVAGEAGVPFFSISGSDFVEMFVGVGASRVRDLFNTAKRSTPAVIFIDEIDAVGRQRGAGLGGGHDEKEQTLNQLLVEMDGFAPNEGIIVIAATNRPDILDPALQRPGRFDRQVTMNYPDVKGREAILRVHARNKKFEPDVDLAVLAQRTPGFTGADLENVLNEAAILTARARRKKITQADLEEAITRVQMGPEKKSRVVTEEDKRYTAYHESGHAILAIELPKCDSLHEVSIISRGMAAGYTMTLPKDDWNHVTRARLEDHICMTMGGRVAEELVLGDISTGASQDLKQNTATARKMVEQYGMSDELGPVFYGGDQEVFIGRDWGHSKEHSESVSGRIDEEISRILATQHGRAKDILSRNMDGLHRTAALLMKYERVTGEQFERVYRGEDMDAVMAAERKEAPAVEPQVEEEKETAEKE
jgi:cell division protease FtsH